MLRVAKSFCRFVDKQAAAGMRLVFLSFYVKLSKTLVYKIGA
jgi:hypothetical protein